ARNEWHGPARGGAAVDGESLYWISGSRVFRVDCNGQKGSLPEPTVWRKEDAPLSAAAKVQPRKPEDLQAACAREVDRLGFGGWAPFVCMPGLSGAERSATHSGEVIEALAAAWPHLSKDDQITAKWHAGNVLDSHPPLTDKMWFSSAGERREDAPVDK